MTSILSFDSRSTRFLLSSDFEEYFDKEYPIFYKNKIQKSQCTTMKFFYRNAIDGALKSNQFSAIEAILQYIIQYQNNYVSSYLFNKNLPQLIENSQSLNEPLIQLFDSQVFQFNFDFDEWPTSHENDTECCRYFNESIFQLRKYYQKVFPEKEFMSMEDRQEQDDEDDQTGKASKVYKIKYQVNMLPMVGSYYYKYTNPYNGETTRFIQNGQINLLEILCAHCSSEESIDIFKTQTILDMMNFKWNNFAFSFHLFGIIYHLFYIVILFAYTYLVYIHPNTDFFKHEEGKAHDRVLSAENAESTEEKFEWKKPDTHKAYVVVLLIGISYPFFYEFNQLYKNGLTDYFSDLGNWVDMLYLAGSVSMAILHFTIGAYAVASKLLMLLVVTLAIRRTFNYLRIFDKLSPIVSMINQVLSDIQTFMLFYFILVFLFSLMIGVLGVANTNIKDSAFTQSSYVLMNKENPDWVANDGMVTFTNGTTAKPTSWENWQIKYLNDDFGSPVIKEGADVPGLEYKYLNLMISNLIATIRASIGDYELRGAATLDFAENVIFWFIWFIQVLLTCIIFLNIIVAEVTNSYIIVSDKLEAVINNQKAELTAEAEEVLPGFKKSENNFPKYIILRKVDQ